MITSYALNPFERYGLLLCGHPGLTCMVIKPGDTWVKLFPDYERREIVMRLNRTNVALSTRDWIVVPTNWKNFNYMNLAPFSHHMTTNNRPLLYVDLSVFAFAAYNADGNLIYWGPATGGKRRCDNVNRSCETATGVFRIYRMQGADCLSSKYPLDTDGGASMPWCMHYYKGFSIHGSTLSGFLNKSQGCVRLFYQDAQWLNQNFVHVGTEVIVKR